MEQQKDITFFILNKHNKVVATLDTGTHGEDIPVLLAEVDGKVNSYDILTLQIPADKDGVEVIEEDFTIIFEDITGWREYIIVEVEDEDSTDATRTILCELSSTELLDDVVDRDIPSAITNPSQVLFEVLRGTRWEVGIVDSSIYSQSFSESSLYKPVLEVVDLMTRNYNCEVHYSYDIDDNKITRRFVNLYRQFGREVGKRFEVGKDITSVKRTVDTSTIKTAIIPYSTPVTDDDGVEGDRLDITNLEWSKENGDPANKPLGQNYIVDPVALEEYGRRDGTEIRNRFLSIEMDVDNVNTLISMGWVQLGRYTKPKMTYEMNVIDLWSLSGDEDLKHENVYLGDSVTIIDDNFAKPLTVITRVVELTRDLLDPTNNKVVLGESKTYFRTMETEDMVEALAKKVDNNSSDLATRIRDISDGTNFWQVNNSMGGTPNMLAGSRANDITENYKGSTIGGGGDLGGEPNVAYADFATIAGGLANGVYGSYGSLLGGYENSIFADFGVIGGGETNVVSDDYGLIGAGKNNLSAAYQATIVNGEDNSAVNENALVVNGKNNNANSIRSTVVNGQNNQANAPQTTVLNGQNNRANSANASVLTGRNNSANGMSSAVVSGEDNQSNGAYSTALGKGASANYEGAIAHASGRFGGNSGSAQTQKVILNRTTNTPTPVTLGIAGTDRTFERIVGNMGVQDLECTVIAQSETGVAKAWKLAVTIADLGSGWKLLRTPVIDELGQSVSANNWELDFKLVADEVAGFEFVQAVIEITGSTETVYWVGNVNITEVIPATGIGLDDEVVL